VIRLNITHLDKDKLLYLKSKSSPMNRVLLLLVMINIIFTLTISNIFLFNLTFPAIKIILMQRKERNIKEKALRFNEYKPNV